MKIIEGSEIANMCDFSFGDQSGVISNVYNAYMCDANNQNFEFVKKYNEIKNTKNTMTLFIDNSTLERLAARF
jgi:hypothetical protein